MPFKNSSINHLHKLTSEGIFWSSLDLAADLLFPLLFLYPSLPWLLISVTLSLWLNSCLFPITHILPPSSFHSRSLIDNISWCSFIYLIGIHITFSTMICSCYWFLLGCIAVPVVSIDLSTWTQPWKFSVYRLRTPSCIFFPLIEKFAFYFNKKTTVTNHRSLLFQSHF